MAVRQKWNINGKGKPAAQPGEGGFSKYSGPDLPKGSWPARLKRMVVGKITSNTENKGKPRISVLLEVDGLEGDNAKYNGHPIWDGLNIIESSVPFVNAFLHGLTDGSEAAKRAVEAAFWDDDKGPVIKKIKVPKGPRAGQVDTHIVKIGKYAINSPKGQIMMQVTTRAGTVEVGANKGDYRCEITGYIPQESTSAGDDEDGIDVEDEDEDDLIADVDDDEDDDIDDEDDDIDVEDDDIDEDEDDDDEDDEDEDEDEDEPVTAGRGKKPF
jgi:hypothetical protein